MNINEFTELIKSCGNYETEEEAKVVIKAFTEALTVVFSKQESVLIKKFGKFNVRLNEGSGGKIPGSNQVYSRPIKIIPNFEASNTLIDKILESK